MEAPCRFQMGNVCRCVKKRRRRRRKTIKTNNCKDSSLAATFISSSPRLNGLRNREFGLGRRGRVGVGGSFNYLLQQSWKRVSRRRRISRKCCQVSVLKEEERSGGGPQQRTAQRAVNNARTPRNKVRDGGGGGGGGHETSFESRYWTSTMRRGSTSPTSGSSRTELEPANERTFQRTGVKSLTLRESDPLLSPPRRLPCQRLFFYNSSFFLLFNL